MEDLNNLVQKAQKGNRDAFGRIYEIYYKKIYRYCRINLRDEAVAEDLAQETFYKAWRSLPTFSLGPGSSIQAFLFRIARNSIIDLSRKKKELPLDDALETPASEDIESEFDRKNEIEKVQQALAKLNEEDRHMVILRFFEEMSNSEIAKIVDSNEGAVRVRLHRILKKLKEILK